MTERADGFESFDEIESLLRSAKDYVRVSDDLRPRVLEAAQSECGDQRVLHILRNLAICVIVVAMSAKAWCSSNEVDGVRPRGLLVWVTSREFLSNAEMSTVAGDVSWREVDSFRELRRRQAEIFSPAPKFVRRKA